MMDTIAWDVTPCVCHRFANVSEELTVSILRVEEEAVYRANFLYLLLPKSVYSSILKM
jgi:hypothetical protein